MTTCDEYKRSSRVYGDGWLKGVSYARGMLKKDPNWELLEHIESSAINCEDRHGFYSQRVSELIGNVLRCKECKNKD